MKNRQFVQTTNPLLSEALMQAAQAYIPAIEGYTSELHPAQYAFTRTLTEKLSHGAMIWIDYSFEAQQYDHPQRNNGTLIGHYRHHTIHDPFLHWLERLDRTHQFYRHHPSHHQYRTGLYRLHHTSAFPTQPRHHRITGHYWRC
ncbi:SAM-dependent methyltransferase [Neisseria iguanae]|uniref:SAM-dependent methyltransferase n=1 Tax=Neisseria iguanae TaxID=90242 RepID=UPI001FE40468|nr:SAM-dependent methyltransferase [Neisseria iguanae]